MKIFRCSRAARAAVASSLLALVVGCSSNTPASSSTTSSNSGSGSAAAANGPVTEVVIGIASPVASFALPQIAADNNLWPPNVHVTFSVMDSNTIGQTLATGKIQMALGAEPRWGVIAGQSGAPISYLADWGNPPDFQMIARPGIDSVAALKGKTIAIPSPGSSVQYLSEVAMEKSGVASGQYKLLSVGNAPEMVSTFVSGTTDAFVLPASSVQPILAKVPGSKVVYDYYTEKVPWEGAGIVGYNPWVKDNEAATVSVLKGLNAALKMVHQQPTKAEPSVTKFIGATNPKAAQMQLKYLVERTPGALQKVSTTVLKSVYADVRKADNVAQPSDDVAQKMVNSDTYLTQATS